ncbi:MAG: hypothetical protein Q4E22_05035 [Coriobacteriia bacterium]|nr:hypothetical protein [Coriobacteriia bacterium]
MEHFAQARKEENNNKKWLIVVLSFLIVAISIGGIYGYWAGTIKNPSEVAKAQEVTIGSAQEVETTLDVTEALAAQGKKLVPAGKTSVSVGQDAENVESFDVTYTVNWKEIENQDIISQDDLVKGTLTVTAAPEIVGATNYNDLVNVVVNPESTEIQADGDAVEVTLKVTLSEPANKVAYDAIVGKTINVKLTFAVTQ